MLDEKTIAVIVPACNEEKLIGKTLDTLPRFVDAIIVVNDGSTDGTHDRIEEFRKRDGRVVYIHKKNNEGLGQALADGYRRARELNFDVAAVMAGDAQMDPGDLEKVVRPVVGGLALYVKGNRLLTPGAFDTMPKYRFIGNSVLSLLTKFATGYFHLMDPQCGYTAIAGPAIDYLDLDHPHKGYGYNAHLLFQLNLHNARVVDVEVKPVYGEETSGIRLSRYIPAVSKLLVKIFLKRIWRKYFIFDFHPVGLCYMFGGLSGLLALYTGALITVERFTLSGPLPVTLLPTMVLWVLASFSAIILILFGMFLDIEYLRVRERMEPVSRL